MHVLALLLEPTQEVHFIHAALKSFKLNLQCYCACTLSSSLNCPRNKTRIVDKSLKIHLKYALIRKQFQNRDTQPILF